MHRITLDYVNLIELLCICNTILHDLIARTMDQRVALSCHISHFRNDNALEFWRIYWWNLKFTKKRKNEKKYVDFFVLKATPKCGFAAKKKDVLFFYIFFRAWCHFPLYLEVFCVRIILLFTIPSYSHSSQFLEFIPTLVLWDNSLWNQSHIYENNHQPI